LLAEPIDARRSRRLPAVLLVLVLVAAGSLAGWYVIEGTSHSTLSQAVRTDGPNFYQVLARLNSSVAHQTGGPWSPFSVVGLAAQADFSPNVKGYYNLNRSVNSCQSALSGVSVWNGTIPVFTGTFNSGTAPFWQIAYFSNSTLEVLITTDVSGAVHVFPPFPVTSNCTLAWFDFWQRPNFWAQQIVENSTVPPNSPNAAMTVWNNIDTSWVVHNAPLVEVLTTGPALFEATQDIYAGDWGVDFIGCGLAGITGERPLISAGTDRNGQYAGVFNASTSCAVSPNATLPSDRLMYQLVDSAPSVSGGGDTTWVTTSFQVALAYTNGTLAGDYDGWGLANWMVSLNLTNATGARLPDASPACESWSPSIFDCVANQSGWYVVLLSAGGEWLASYGASASGGAWSVAVTGIVSHQMFVIVLPSGWAVSGDNLRPNSTTTYSEVRGIFPL